MIKERNSEQHFFNVLKNNFGNKEFLNEGPVEVKQQGFVYKERYDFLINVADRKLCIIEFKSTTIDEKLFKTWITSNLIDDLNVRFLSMTNGDLFLVKDKLNPKIVLRINGIEAFVNLILKPISREVLDEVKELVKQTILIKTKKHFKTNQTLIAHVENVSSNLKLSKRYELYFEGSKEDDQSFENKYFELMLNDGENSTTIYRYTGLSSIFETIKNKSIRMSGLPGMNDITEANYVDNYLKETKLKLHEELPQTIEAVNRRFILCCTSLADDLLQWRLYGDDCKCVCLEFSVDNKKLIQRNGEGKRGFYLGKVRYANRNNKHKELELIKEIISDVKKKTGLNIRFTMLYVWKHFFKPKEYAYENEIRLLCIKRNNSDKKWNLTTSHNIANPFVEFMFNEKSEFPLNLKKVTLGNKCPEKELNKVQLKRFKSEQGLNVEIEISEITNYR